MTRRLFVWRDNQMMEVDLDYRPPPVNAPFVITDTIPRTYCHGTGRFYESRKERALDMKAHGVEAVDSSFRAPTVNTDPSEDEIIADIKEAKRMVQWGEAPLDEAMKHECKVQNERLGKHRRPVLKRRRVRTRNATK